MRFDYDISRSFAGALGLIAMLTLTSCSGSDGVLKNIGGNQNDAREQAVIANMRTLRLAVNAYSYKHGNKFPTSVDGEFKECFPKGSADGALFNPYSKKHEWPTLGTVRNVAEERKSAPRPLEPGVVEYSPVDGGKSYAIRGGGTGGKAIAGEGNPNSTLVLSAEDESDSQ